MAVTCAFRSKHHDTALPFKTTQYVRIRMVLAPEVEERGCRENELDRGLRSALSWLDRPTARREGLPMYGTGGHDLGNLTNVRGADDVMRAWE